MRWALLLVVVGCLPHEGNKSKATEFNSADYQGDFQSFYYKYIFSYQKELIDIALKIDRDTDGKFTKLQTIDLREKKQINSIPLTEKPVYIAGGAARAGVRFPDYKFHGDSYLGQGGSYIINYYGDNMTISDIDPPEIMFIPFPLENNSIVTVQSEAVNGMTANEWQRLVRERPRSPTFPEPQPLPAHLKSWFYREFSQLKKLEHKRVITIDNNTYYGAVHQAWSESNSCWMQYWGFDNRDVVQFLYRLRDEIDFDKVGEDYRLSCSGNNDVVLTCADGVRADQDVFYVANNRLIVSNRSVGITGYMDDRGRCHAGRP